MARLCLTLLGGFEARLDPGGALALPARKTTALLAYLAIPPGQPHPRDKLAALLWGDTDSSKARPAIRQVLFNLRRMIAVADPLRLVGETVALDPEAVDVDVTAFEREVADGSPEALERGIALYRGDLLAGLARQEPPFEEWLLAERERLREMALEAMARLLARQREDGALERAVKTAAGLLALDPMQEPVHRTLMRLYAATGRRGAALRQYQVCVTALQRELGIEPEPETKELYQHILRLRPGRTNAGFRSPAGQDRERPGDAGAPPPAPAPDVPLVGRKNEMDGLRVALDTAIAGRGSLIGILGEAGLGKSRLVEQVEREAAARGARIVRGRAYEAAQILSYGPWVDALQTAGVAEDLGLLGSLDPIRRAELGRILPGAWPSGAPPGASEPLHVFEALARVIDAMSRQQPLLLVLEDVHWADEMSVRVLAFLGRRLHASPMLGVVTVREEDLEVVPFLRRALEDLERGRQLVVIRLAPLSRGETLALARHVAPRASGDESLGDRLWRMTGGNPFLIVEAMRLVHEGAMPEALSAVASERVRQLVERRLARLGSPGRQLAAAAAVMGRECEFEMLRAAARLDGERAAEGLEELVRHRILHRVGESFGFAHDHIRAVVYETLFPPRRALLHRRAGALLEELGGADLGPHLQALGLHYRLGEVWDKAADYLERAGRAASQKSAHRSAATAYGEAIAALGRLPESARQRERACDLHFARAYSVGWSGAIEDSLAGHTRSLALAESLGDRSRLQRGLTGTCSALASTGRYAEALAAARRALAMATRAADMGGQFWANINLARTAYALGDYRGAVDHCRRSQACLSLSPELSGAVTRDLPPPVAYRTWLVLNLAMLGDFATGGAVGEELASLIATMDWPRARVSAAASAGHLALLRGHVAAAISILEPALRLCRDAELWAFFPRIASALGTALALGGRPAGGLVLIEEAVAQSRASGYLYDQAALLGGLATAHLEGGSLDAAAQVALEALALARAQGARGSEVQALRVAGEVALRRIPPDASRASTTLEEALALAKAIGARPVAASCHLALGSLHRRADHLEQAREHLAIAAAEFRAMGMTASLARAESELG